jgi:hypothetical protein
MPEIQPWSPDHPKLYMACCAVHGSDGPDTLQARFGMRECSIKDNRFQLNNKPVLLRGVVLGATDVSSCRESAGAGALIKSLKSAGFNFLRVRGAPAPAPLLDGADELGFLICNELDPASDRAHIESTVVSRRNHPSIAMWHIAGTGDNASLLRRVHQIDPTRLAVTGLDVLDGAAHFMRPYQDDMGQFDAVTAHLPPPCSGRDERFYEHVGGPNMPAVLASFGARRNDDAIAEVPPRHTESESGLASDETDRMFADIEQRTFAIDAARTESLTLQVQAARVNAKIACYCADGPPTADAVALGRVQSPLMLAIRASRTNLVPREEVPVTVTVVNDERIEPLADLSLQVVGPTNQVLWKKKRSIKVPKQTREIWTGTISASGSVGVHRFVVRLMQGMKLLAQNSIDLHVVEPAAPCDLEVSVLDPHGEWTQRCTTPALPAGGKPRLYVVPPLANTVRAYPENDLINLLNEVRAGAVALVFGPPADWNDLAMRIDDALKATTIDSAAAYHYVRLHPIFDGLPSRCLMLQPYRNVVPRRSFDDLSDERVCGAIAENAGGADVLGEDILVRRFGSGRVVFTHARILEHLGTDPVANRLYANLLRHFGRRSVPGEITQPIQQSVLDWLRRERSERARLWYAIGPFENWDGAGHETKYPPEQQVDLSAVHAGWRDPVRWSRWYAIGDVHTEIDLDAALELPFTGPTTVLPETYFAYAECNAPTRQQAVLHLNTTASIKVFVNGALCHERATSGEDTTSVENLVPATLKQGKNSILIKLSRSRSPAHVTLDLSSASRDPLIFKWWR